MRPRGAEPNAQPPSVARITRLASAGFAPRNITWLRQGLESEAPGQPHKSVRGRAEAAKWWWKRTRQFWWAPCWCFCGRHWWRAPWPWDTCCSSMLATLSVRCSSIRRVDGREHWLQQQLNLCAFPYVRLVNQRISRARQTMDKGGPDKREATQTLSVTGLSTRRRSCPMRLLVDDPDKLVRPSSACGFYKDPPIPMSPQEEEMPPSKPQHRSSAPENFYTSHTNESRGEESAPVDSQPKVPAVMKRYTRGVVAPEVVVEKSGTTTSQQQPVAGTSDYQDLHVDWTDSLKTLSVQFIPGASVVSLPNY